MWIKSVDAHPGHCMCTPVLGLRGCRDQTPRQPWSLLVVGRRPNYFIGPADSVPSGERYGSAHGVQDAVAPKEGYNIGRVTAGEVLTALAGLQTGLV